MNFIIISHEPFRMKMREDFYMDQFKADGFDVSYWCVHRVLEYSSKGNYINMEASEGVRYFDQYDELLSELKALNEDTVLCLDLWFVSDTAEILSILAGSKVKLFKIDYFRNYPTARSAKSKLVKSLKALDFKRIYDAFSRKLVNVIFGLRMKLQGIRLEFPVFVPGQLTGAEGERIISIAHFDVATYEKSLASAPLLEGNYYVFIDIFLPYHPDFGRAGSGSVEPEAYFKRLRTLFDDIESQTGHQVVIAAHPKSKYKHEFGSRPCYYNQTAVLINHSQGVITHHSTAINFAVLAYKPLVLLSSKAFRDTDYKNFILEEVQNGIIGYQNALACTVVDMEDKIDSSSFMPVNVELYDRFKSQYLLSTAFPKSNYEIIKDELHLTRQHEAE